MADPLYDLMMPPGHFLDPRNAQPNALMQLYQSGMLPMQQPTANEKMWAGAARMVDPRPVGQRVNEALGPLGVGPLGDPGGRPTSWGTAPLEMLMGAANALPAGRLPTLYHGSRKVFDRPDVSKVGTGTDMGWSSSTGYRPSETGAEGYGFNTTVNQQAAADYARQGMKSPGHLYEVNAAKVPPEQILDWSKPMREQSAYVRSRLQWPDESMTGKEVYESLSRGFPGRAGEHGDKSVSEFLSSLGIHGHRTKMGGATDYIWYRTELLDLLRKYGLAAPVGGAIGASQFDQQ